MKRGLITLGSLCTLTLHAQASLAPQQLPAAAATQLTRSLDASKAHSRHVWRDTPAMNADGTVNGFNPATGAAVPMASQDATVRTYAAGAATAYAVAKGVMNTVAPFYSGTTPITGIIN